MHHTQTRHLVGNEEQCRGNGEPEELVGARIYRAIDIVGRPHIGSLVPVMSTPVNVSWLTRGVWGATGPAHTAEGK